MPNRKYPDTKMVTMTISGRVIAAAQSRARAEKLKVSPAVNDFLAEWARDYLKTATPDKP